MAKIDTLLERIPDPQLREALTTAVNEVRRTKDFGLVFESHLPETVRLPLHPVRKGVKVTFIDSEDESIWVVQQIKNGVATLIPLSGSEHTQDAMDAPLRDLVVIADFGDTIYPGLRKLGNLVKSPEKRCNLAIKAENYHALEALTFSHAERLDCVYIDPPYNTGSRDWKYGNDYIDKEDGYRHSKWLAFMERRLRLAKKLLNPENSILICAIDDREVHRLGLLLSDVFPGAEIQLVTVVINRAGSPRPGRLTRVDEYLFYVFIGEAKASEWSSNLLSDDPEDVSLMPTVWFSAIRVGGRKALRDYYTETELFYPVLIHEDTGLFHSVGPPLQTGKNPGDYQVPKGTVAIWPVSGERQQTWRFSREKMIEFFENGTARLGRRDRRTGLRPVTYLRPGTLRSIKDGTFVVLGKTPEGALRLGLAGESDRLKPAATVWNVTSHYARDHGSKLNNRLTPGREFPYPKALYAVEDALRVAVGDKPNAIVLDFFAGSGTTGHALARLNRQDGGQRQAILVTNNDVSAAEARLLTSQGHRPGDPEWERHGIFEHIMRPRIEAAITGETPSGRSVTGDYAFTDVFPMAEGFSENYEFLELTFQDPNLIELDMAFESIAPMLWLRAGAIGRMIETNLDESGAELPYAATPYYGILFNPDHWRGFIDSLGPQVQTVYLVTNSTTTFTSIAEECADHVKDVVRLYERYLSTFAINQAQEL